MRSVMVASSSDDDDAPAQKKPATFVNVAEERRKAKEAAKLAKDAENEKKRQQIAEFYSHELRETPLSLPSMSSDIDPAWHLYVIRSEQRDYLQANLSEDKIDTVIHYPTPPHCQKAYSEFSQATKQLPITEKIKKEVLSLSLIHI